ncbi:hypothetical protein C5167_040973 [Papaver somniferum]|uniref:Bet v I/Major latex protein domain-containing protein n=1 Tax=Papaver somniferum TaxID=3469 RepID=A0A4Y7IGL8_PAPSO|nr:S-norcoclaurine synthase 1-like [Papaver somniferum]RZC48024.1 hypothetical protein C5167_040973 [Papaver somniferum]
MRKEIVFVLFLVFLMGKESSAMRYKLINEIDVDLSARSIWNVYSSKDLPSLIVKLLPEVFERIDILEGNGGVGTVCRIVFPPGSVPRTYKEMFTKIDHVHRLKVIQQVSGGYLAMGVTSYTDMFKIISTGPNSCIIRSTTEYEVPDHLADKVNTLISIEGLVPMAHAIIKYVKEFGDQVNIDDSANIALPVGNDA